MRCLSLFLSFLLSAPFATPAGAQTAAAKISLVIVEGEGAINNIRQRTAREPIVQVEDENHKPIAGAAVVFTLPSQGAGGTFAGGAHTMTVTTNNQGQAVARGFRPNTTQGQFQIHVNASYSGQSASAVISQTNTLVAGAAAATGAGISAKLITILAVSAAAVAGGVVAVTRGGGTTANSATIPAGVTTTPGTGTVGPPR